MDINQEDLAAADTDMIEQYFADLDHAHRYEQDWASAGIDLLQQFQAEQDSQPEQPAATPGREDTWWESERSDDSTAPTPGTKPARQSARCSHDRPRRTSGS